LPEEESAREQCTGPALSEVESTGVAGKERVVTLLLEVEHSGRGVVSWLLAPTESATATCSSLISR